MTSRQTEKSTSLSQEAKNVRKPKAKTSNSVVHQLSHPSWALMRKTLDREHKGKKTGTKDTDSAFTEGMQATAGLFVSPSQTYLFRLVAYYNVSSTSGSVASYFTLDPSAFSEHTAYLKYLFQEVRIRRSTMTILPRNVSTGPDGAYPSFAWSSTWKYFGSNPTSAGAVLDEGNSCIRNSAQTYHGGAVREDLQKTIHVPTDFMFASVDSTVPQIGYGGYGQWWIHETTTCATDAPFATVMLENIYEYRSRD